MLRRRRYTLVDQMPSAIAAQSNLNVIVEEKGQKKDLANHILDWNTDQNSRIFPFFKDIYDVFGIIVLLDMIIFVSLQCFSSISPNY